MLQMIVLTLSKRHDHDRDIRSVLIQRSKTPRKDVKRDRKGIVPDVVIVPIVWKERREECESIFQACKELQRGINKAGELCTIVMAFTRRGGD